MQPIHGGPALTSVAVGVTFAVLVGAAVIPFLKRLVELSAGLDVGDRGKRVPAWLTGLVERTLFTLIVAYDLSGAVTGMMAWIGLKMAANWNSPQAQLDETVQVGHREILNRRFTALITSALAMGIALIGGVIGSGKIPINGNLLWISGTAIIASLLGSLILNWSRKRAVRATAA